MIFHTRTIYLQNLELGKILLYLAEHSHFNKMETKSKKFKWFSQVPRLEEPRLELTEPYKHNSLKKTNKNKTHCFNYL